MINIYTLNSKREQRKKNKAIFYHKVLNLCYNKITYYSDKMQVQCFFTVPKFILGIPIYNLEECSKYISLYLQKKGFKSLYIKPNIVYIYWGHIPSYVSNPELSSNAKLIEYKPKEKGKKKYRDINDYHKGNNFIYNLPNFKKKKKNLFLK